MEKIFETRATLACGIFTGAAVYINLVEHPARMQCAQGWPQRVRSQLPQSLCDAGFPGGYRFCAVTAAWLMGAVLVVGGRSPSRFRDSVHFDFHYADQQEITESGPGQRTRTYAVHLREKWA
jgi:hypothetical protein